MMSREVAMTDWTPVSRCVGVLVMLLAFPVAAQPAGTGASKALADGQEKEGKPVEALSAEERIRRATLPPPGKACAPDPKEAERAKQDARHARNLGFVAVSDQTVDQANEIAGRAWASQRARLAAESRADLETWLNAQATRTAASSVANPCRLEKPQGHGANAPNAEQRRRLLQDLMLPADLILSFSGGSERDTPSDRDCGEGARWQSDRELFTRVRGELGGGRLGTRLLVASTSNVPVTCVVDALVRRKGEEVTRTSLTFDGAGMQGGVAKEIELGTEVDPTRDELVLTPVCVPRLVWKDGGAVLTVP